MRRRKNRNQTILRKSRESLPSLSESRLRFYRRRQQMDTGLVREVLIWAGEILLVIALAAVLVYFIGFRVPVVGQSMSPTLENGDQVLVNRFTYQLLQPKANDLIVFLPNGNENSHYYIKRVVGVPGDTVQVQDGKVYVNGKPFKEKGNYPKIDNALLAAEPVKVGEDEYFVLGDNRNNSEDSRYAGMGNVKKEHIIGKAWLRIFPFHHLGTIK